jgi:hypothetical protein
VGLPLAQLLSPRRGWAGSGQAKRVIFFYFPDGVAGLSQNGDPSAWHCTGSEHQFQLGQLLTPLAAHKDECLFFNGLSMGSTDAGSHPGGAKKLLTAVDGGQGESIDQMLARTAGAAAPYKHLYLGAQANVDNASGDKHISYPSAGQSITPEDDPLKAFDLLFGNLPPGGSSGEPQVDPRKVSVIDSVIDDVERLRTQLGQVEKAKLDLHLESLREVEKRIKGLSTTLPGASCDMPSIDTTGITQADLYKPEAFPAIVRAQTDLMVLAMACGLTQVGTLQASHHTSSLLMSRFAGTPMYDPNFDMRSHQASHYGASHDPAAKEYAAYVQQRQWWVSQFAYLLSELKARPEGDGSMLDHSLVLLCTEVCDGNTHLHDDMPFVLAGRGGGAVSPGRLLSYGYQRHANLLVSIAHAMGQNIAGFGDASSGPLDGVLS